MKSVPKLILLLFVTLFIGMPSFVLAASILGHIKIDNFGYRTLDYKIAYFTSNPGATVGVYNASTSVLAYTVPAADIASEGTDTTGITGDTVWWANFSAFTTPGTYYIYSTSLNEQSYNFQIKDCIYQAPMTATLKALYYQRCGCAHPAAYAGANWSDAATCHLQDKTCGPAPGCTYPNTYGTLDLSGGWHDAGDFNKYIGSTPAGSCNSWGGDSGEAIHDLMLAYEWNPTLFSSLSSNIPESGNGNPDILNEAKWELDWYLKMQMTDKHVLSVVHATGGGGASPPSTDAQTRYYYPPNGDGEAQFVAMLSNSARVMSTVPGLASYATTLRSAAEATWNAYETTWTSDDLKFWAAAEIFRMEEALGGPASIITSAQTFVDGYQTWNGFWLNEDKIQQNWGILAYIESTNATASVVTYMKADWSTLMNDLFGQTDNYNSAMHSWDYYWGADEVKMNYAMELLWAAKLGATGSQSVSQCNQHAEDFLHYMNGANTLNMTLMTNSNAIGASHGIWRIYHQWFGNYNPVNGPGTYSYDNFIGKPVSVIDPLYPYYSGTDNFGISDSGPSSFGPPPGIVPDGPSNGYAQGGGQSMPPMLTGEAAPPYEKGYRDWDWVDPNGNQSVPWIVNETGLYYTASYMVVASAFTTVCATGPTPTPTPTSTPTASFTSTASYTPTPTPTRSFTSTPSNTPTPTATPTLTATWTNTATRTPTATFTATNSFTPTQTLINSATPTNTPTITNTPTNTFSPTSTNSPTPSLTPTATHTSSPTPTVTSSPTPSLTPTPTNTPTITNTPTNTFSPTSTNTPTPSLTPTSTHTLSPTPTATLSPTPTSTSTPSNTPTITNTPTNTFSPTSTSSPTPTLTPTTTNSPTPTWTATYSPTTTSTPTKTYTPTITNTPTNTPSPTPSFSPTPSLTPTPTNSPTPTPTATLSPTPTLTPTITNTPTQTQTPSPTSSVTPTSTPTSTATSVTVSGTGSPVTLSVISGTAGVTVLQETLSDPSGIPVTLSSLVLNDTGTGNPVSGIQQAIVLINGTQVGGPVVFSGNQATFNLGNVVITGTATVEIEVNFVNTATGSYTVAMPIIVGYSGNNGGQLAVFTGLPAPGNNVVVSQPSPTFTVSPTSTVTLPPTQTPTITVTPPANPSLFPNPVSGNTVNVYIPFGGDVEVDVYTLTFRKVISKPLGQQLPGITVSLTLTDNWGGTLADGLYYVVVKSQGKKWVGKLLILR